MCSAQNQAEDQSRMDQDPQEETEGVDTAGIDRLHKFQQDMNKIIEERDANSLVRPLGSDYLLAIWLFNENVFVLFDPF